MAITAAYVASNQFSVAADRVSQFPAKRRVKANCGVDGYQQGVVASVSGTTVTLTMDAGAALTANLVAVSHGALTTDALPHHGHTGATDGGNIFATNSEAQAGSSTALAVTPAGLAASAKGLISANTTIYVATTGSDTTGTGLVGAPYASIAKALSSIASKLIAAGVTVTIQVADGTYTIINTIVIDHPDGGKIKILGNTSAETTVAIASIDTTAKTITVTGDYTASISVGDVLDIRGSSTVDLNGSYVVSGREYTGGSTVVTCSAETFASSTVGGGSLVIMPNNKCILNTSVDCFSVTTSIGMIQGFRINATAANLTAVRATDGGIVFVKGVIAQSFLIGFASRFGGTLTIYGVTAKSCTRGVNASYDGTIIFNSGFMSSIDTCALAVIASSRSYVVSLPAYLILRGNTTTYSPAIDVVGNSNSIISST